MSIDLGDDPGDPALQDVLTDWASGFAERVVQGKAHRLCASIAVTDVEEP